MAGSESIDATTGPAPSPSPCVGVCELVAGTGLCRGCLRTMAEISGWPALGEAGKRLLLDRLARRAAESGRGPAGAHAGGPLR